MRQKTPIDGVSQEMQVNVLDGRFTLGLSCFRARTAKRADGWAGGRMVGPIGPQIKLGLHQKTKREANSPFVFARVSCLRFFPPFSPPQSFEC